MTALSAGAVTAVLRQEPKRSRTCPGRRSWSARCCWADLECRSWDEFGASRGSVHNTAMATQSRSQMCVQCCPSIRSHSVLLREEFGIRYSGAFPSENLLVRIFWLNHVASVKSRDRAKIHVGVRTIEESLIQDMRVPKPLCSRCALNVSFWGILWHSVSDLDARNLLIEKVSP